jgi:transcriptional regulator with XRE-family HTH domain
MKLRDFLSRACLTESQFGATIGVSQGSVNRYARGLRVPRPSVMARIVTRTEGKVRPDDFFDLSAGQSSRAAD